MTRIIKEQKRRRNVYVRGLAYRLFLLCCRMGRGRSTPSTFESSRNASALIDTPKFNGFDRDPNQLLMFPDRSDCSNPESHRPCRSISSIAQGFGSSATVVGYRRRLRPTFERAAAGAFRLALRKTWLWGILGRRSQPVPGHLWPACFDSDNAVDRLRVGRCH